MVKINKSLWPIKAHFFFFMAAMGPILPQLAVIGKQMGISPEVMGYIMSILPVLYVLAKPLIGFVADYFASYRKFVFITLITVMTLSYMTFYFIPATDSSHSIKLDTWDITIDPMSMEKCTKEILMPNSRCTSTRWANCSTDSFDFEAFFSSQLPPNIVEKDSIYMCHISDGSLNISRPFNASCQLEADQSCLYTSASFWIFVLCLFVGTIGFNVTNSISDAICFDMLGEKSDKYGAQRVWGTIGFGITALLSGFIVDFWTTEAIKSFTPALIIMLVFSGLDLLSVSKLRLPKLSSSESIFKDVLGLVQQPAIAVFLVFATIAGIIDSFIIYFMFWHLEDVAAATGYIDQIKLIEGCVVAAECLAGEIPFFFYSGKIIKKLGYVHCMSMCFFFYAVRLALISWIPNPWYLVVVELFFQGITYALCYTCIVAYASAVAPPGTSATVQGLMAGMDDGLGFSIGSLIGGLCLKNFGGRRSFLYFSIMAICTCFAHIIIRPSSRKNQHLPEKGYELPKEQFHLELVSPSHEIKA